MSKSYPVQTSFLGGVLDPRASARIETEAYAQGLLTGDNVTVHHLGGVRRRPGSRYRAKMPYKLSRVVAVPAVTVPEGGTAQSANDFDQTTLVETTNNVGTTDPYVVVRYDLGSAQSILFADVLDIFSTGGASTEFCIQHSADDTNWTVFESTFPLVDTVSRSYRRGGTPVSARYWRVAKVGGTDMGAVTISMSSFNLWQSTANVSEGVEIAFEVSAEEGYCVVLTDRSATVFDEGVYVRSVPTPYVSDDLAGIDAVVSPDGDTMVVVHDDYEPHYFIKEVDDNFQLFPIDFDAIPQTDFNDSLSPTPTSEVQVITFVTFDPGDTFQISLDGARTDVVVFAGDAGADDRAATAANIAREVQKLYTVLGFTGVSCARTGANEYTVTFAAASAGAYGLMAVTPVTSDGSATVTRSAAGVPRSEPLWSATRGYPRTVAFHGGRLYFGGTRSRKSAVIGSEVFNAENMLPAEGLADEPIFTPVTGQKMTAIQGLYSGRSLQIFAAGGEHRYVKAQGEPVVPSDAPVNQTEYGSAKIPPVNIDGATLYVQLNRKSIRDFRFDYEEEAFSSLGVSSLAPHLINDVVGLAAWNGSRDDEIGLVFVVNGDGTLAVLNTRKEAKVQAWTRWTTQGEFKAVRAVLQSIFVLVRRTINGVPGLYFEQFDDDYYTDCAFRKTGPDSTSVAGLDHLNGQECRVRADQFVLQDRTPSAGAITIERASSDVEVGLNFNTEVTTMPLVAQTPAGPNFMRPRRIVKPRVKVRNTLGLICNDRELGDRSYDINFFDEPADPFTGVHPIEDSTNWDEADEKTITLRQVDPLPMEILAIEAEMEG